MLHSYMKLSVLFILFLDVTSLSIKFEVDTSDSKEAKIEGATKDFKYSDEYNALMAPHISRLSKFAKTISEQKCMEYIYELVQKIDNTDDTDVSIINGKVVEDAEYSHMGALGWKQKSSGNGTGKEWIFYCGASLISDKFMLTAAHCTHVHYQDMSPKPEIVRLGTRFIEGLKNDSHTDVTIEKLISHPRYNAPDKYYDIALVKLAKRVTFSKFIQPACLVRENYDERSKKKLIATGWGETHTGARIDEGKSRVLRSAEIDVFDHNQCEDLLNKHANRHWSGMTPHEMCAGQLDGTTDTCKGDSGGPLQYLLLNTTQGSIHRIVSITSFGLTPCATKNAPGIYTKISSMLGWIEYNVWWLEDQNEMP